MPSIRKLAVIGLVFAIVMVFVRQYCLGPMCESTAFITGKTVLVTGANAGLGFETAVQLALRGGKIHVACRNKQKCDAAVKEIKNITSSETVYPEIFDLGSLKSVRNFVEDFKKRVPKLNILINNAGYLGPRVLTVDGYEQTFAVNHLGHFLLTSLLIDNLKAAAPSRVVTVSSFMYRYASLLSVGHLDLDDLMYENSYDDYVAYARSKIANILFSYELAKRLKDTGVTTYSLHPGSISTALGDDASLGWMKNIITYAFWPFMKDTLHGVQTTICCAIDEGIAKHTGKYYQDTYETETESYATDDVVAQKLWQISERLVGLSN